MLQCCVMFFFKFFFFQAEDGIRDRTVTGVQTCALPISNVNCGQYGNVANNDNCATIASGGFLEATGSTLRSNGTSGRSEERRVGKECRCRWVTYQYKEKKRVILSIEQHAIQ